MSKRILSAVLSAGVIACFAAPAQARLDNGPVSSQYDAGRKSAKAASTSRYKYKKTANSRSYGKRKYAKKSGSSAKGRAMTAGHTGKGGASASRSCLQASARALLDRILAGDPGAARAAMEEHCDATAELLRGLLT